MKKPRPYHPFFLASYFVLLLFANSVGEVPFTDVWPTLSVTLLGTLLLFVAVRMIVSDSAKAALVVSILLVMTLSFVRFIVVAILLGIGPILFCSLWVVLFATGCYLAVSRCKNLSTMSRVLNVVFGALVTFNAANIVLYKVQSDLAFRGHEGAIEALMADSLPAAVDAPDIYYLIFDRYASSKNLEDQFSFDNSQFVAFLESRGFFVASESHSNYLKTAPSLASSLNMAFLDDLIEVPDGASSNWLPMHSLIKDNALLRLLKARGYRYIHLGSWWEATRTNPRADLNFNLYRISEFSRVFFATSLIYPIAQFGGFYDQRRMHWQQNKYELEKLLEVPAMPGPKFVFAHFLLPHEPYVFEPDGTFLSARLAAQRTGQENYLNQLTYTNQAIQELVESILTASQKEPIIVIQSDEGPFPVRYAQDQKGFDWREATADELKLKLGILNAYYLPGAEVNSFLHPGVTPVNTFRLILNTYFDAGLQVLPDRIFAFDNEQNVYDFFDVTDKLREK